MPKINLTERDKDNERLRNNLWTLQGHLTQEQMAKIIGVKAATTYKNRLDDPSSLTYAEMKRLCKHFRIKLADFTEGKIGIGVS